MKIEFSSLKPARSDPAFWCKPGVSEVKRLVEQAPASWFQQGAATMKYVILEPLNNFG